MTINTKTQYSAVEMLSLNIRLERNIEDADILLTVLRDREAALDAELRAELASIEREEARQERREGMVRMLDLVMKVTMVAAVYAALPIAAQLTRSSTSTTTPTHTRVWTMQEAEAYCNTGPEWAFDDCVGQAMATR